jgi:hypothetical protein
MLMLAGFGAALARTDLAALSQVRSIAIISAVGDDISLRRSGLTPFGGNRSALDAGWDADTYFRARLTQFLAPRFDVRDIVYDKAPFLPKTCEAFLCVPHPLSESLPKALAGLPRTGVDAFVIVQMMPIDTTVGTFQGLGEYGTTTTETVYAYYQIKLVEANTRALIASGAGQLAKPTAGTSDRSPTVRRDWSVLDRAAFFYPSSAEKFDPEQKSKLVAELKDLIDRSLGPTLRNVGLLAEGSDLYPAGEPPQVAIAARPRQPSAVLAPTPVETPAAAPTTAPPHAFPRLRPLRRCPRRRRLVPSHPQSHRPRPEERRHLNRKPPTSTSSSPASASTARAAERRRASSRRACRSRPSLTKWPKACPRPTSLPNIPPSPMRTSWRRSPMAPEPRHQPGTGIPSAPSMGHRKALAKFAAAIPDAVRDTRVRGPCHCALERVRTFVG